ncbi:helix-turn-helix domain-containing protein, partial [Agrococcus sediminis]|uniref:helix-turn-helix domain-containing protein n=1 Tax=Agrococcus sediminis TaxID=2599924 RepID=UPI00343646F4
MPQVIPRLSPFGRALIVERVGSGRPVAHVAAELGVSRQTAYRWVKRYREGGVEALFDRSSRPHASPNRTTQDREAAVLAARAELRQGPARLAAVTGVPARTISRIL